MVSTRARLILVGTNFSPSAAEVAAGVRFSKTSKKGEQGSVGRYKGQPLPYGSAELDADRGPEFLTAVDQSFFAKAAALAEAARSQGDLDVLLHIDVEYFGQCNLEIAPAVLAAFHALGGPLTISCYESGS